jgi:hypothetical protein
MEGAQRQARPIEAVEDPGAGEARRASARLPERQREALSLQGDDGLSYEEIAARMDLSHEAVARLIAHARINLYDELRGTPLASVPSADCERAMGAIAAREDGELEPDSEEAAWLDDHLSGCERCALAIEQMREAASAYSGKLSVAAVGGDPQLPRSHRADPRPAPRGTGDPPRTNRISRRRVVLAAIPLALVAAGAAAALVWRGDSPAPAGSAVEASAGSGAGGSVNRGEGDPASEGRHAKGENAGEKAGKREKRKNTTGEPSGNAGAAVTGPASSGTSAPPAAGGGSGDGNGGDQTASNRQSSSEAGVGATQRTSSPPRTSKPKSPSTSTQASPPAATTPTTTTTEASPPAEEPPDEPGHRGEPPGKPAGRPAR